MGYLKEIQEEYEDITANYYDSTDVETNYSENRKKMCLRIEGLPKEILECITAKAEVKNLEEHLIWLTQTYMFYVRMIDKIKEEIQDLFEFVSIFSDQFIGLLERFLTDLDQTYESFQDVLRYFQRKAEVQ